MRILIEARGRRIIDLHLMAPSRAVPASPPARETSPGQDPHSTLAAQIEQASEPAPGFGFRGSVATIVSRDVPGG